MVKGIIRKGTKLFIPTKAKIEVGDVVKIREDLTNAHTGIPEDDLEMLRGEYVTISRVSDVPNKYGQFECRLKGEDYYWSDAWFE